MSSYTYFKLLLCCLIWSNLTYCSNASYISLSGQLSNKLQIDILTNNLANKSTKGFIADVPTLNAKEIKKLYFVSARNVSFEKGPRTLKHTGRDLDLAIKETGYFKVLVNGEERYTLNGSVFLSKESKLVNHEGFPFLDTDNKEILALGEAGKFSVAANGEIFFSKGRESDLTGQIGVFEFNLDTAKKDSLGYVQSSDALLKEDCQVLQGYLTESSVDSIKTMSEVLNIRNSLECNVNLLSNSFKMDKAAIETLKISR
jgi:flagellar basal-body rod protein FlgF